MTDASSTQVSAASVFGQMGAPGNAGYCASKAAVIGLSRTAAKENPHVRINCVSPGKPPSRVSGHTMFPWSHGAFVRLTAMANFNVQGQLIHPCQLVKTQKM